MNNLWPIGILSAIGVFVCAMIYTVVLTFQNDYVLESEHYYEKTLAYDQVIEAERAGRAYFAGVAWNKLSDGDIALNLPSPIDSATCTLMHPVNDKLDRPVETHQQKDTLVLQLSNDPPFKTSWRLQLTAYTADGPVQIRRRWTY